MKVTQIHKVLENELLEGKLLLKQKELYYLKQQIHPHFLFNTLNTVYGFALKQSEETPDLILKLSELLDYILHQIEKPSVPLSEEVKYIESYLDLEHIRFRDRLRVSFSKEITNDAQVPPMLFMAFVENAFKHGGVVNGFLEVVIEMNANKERLEFSCKNTLSTTNESIENHGLGLQNTRKRLDVLFPNAYTLQVDRDNGWYQISLEINSTEHEQV